MIADTTGLTSSISSTRCFRPDEQKPERLRLAFADDLAADVIDPALELRAAAIHGAFRAFVLDPNYSCVGAKSAINRGSYRLGLYDRLGSPHSARELSADLALFAARLDQIDPALATFVAVFDEPRSLDEASFEKSLWSQLQLLHHFDRRLFEWDPTVSSDPASPHFSFSVGGCAFFVVGLHPGSARLSRQFPWPALVFNPHAQFERLREEGKYERMQQVIREKERELQGEINPVLRDFGQASEALQYSGRAVEPDWAPPFVARSGDGAALAPAKRKCPFTAREG